MDLKALIRDIPDFPKPGILFRDITTILNHAEGWRTLVDDLSDRCREYSPDYIVGIESRGFILGAPLAYTLGVGFVPVRKPGKLPAAVFSQDYELEYGRDRIEMHQDAFPPGSRILIVDDLIATGGTAAAAAQLVSQGQGNLVAYAFVVELVGLGGRSKLPAAPIITLLDY
ncbi:adenine phosphoribosyltransferase [Prochlorothrix hollandica]|uniref:Adenine phosphoribosyltransferase n=1 Tax=Prochlorothrix hollandica PCC 9006 = CALU 1027 TaxID=317619 RepID=A0A0M2PZ82_PROHO|nr:adenine phosphoribosyltransferase [Prochlorothrix hollandica]KKI99706.1 adenine phosphoribosyltransferase [Prochlorothrix hollandica PCC 9006 = CALU 1027]